MSIELHTLGYVVDNLKTDEVAIKVLGSYKGQKLYISRNGNLCCNGESVDIVMANGEPKKLWAIVKVDA